jgi:hypothetical protein
MTLPPEQINIGIEPAPTQADDAWNRRHVVALHPEKKMKNSSECRTTRDEPRPL